jgi:NAD(P)-dependent dehydrogenase (short-subunit alcohol dehydrogenase family)
MEEIQQDEWSDQNQVNYASSVFLTLSSVPLLMKKRGVFFPFFPSPPFSYFMYPKIVLLEKFVF